MPLPRQVNQPDRNNLKIEKYVDFEISFDCAPTLKTGSIKLNFKLIKTKKAHPKGELYILKDTYS